MDYQPPHDSIFRFLKHSVRGADEVLPVLDRYLINGPTPEAGRREVPPAKAWPWWGAAGVSRHSGRERAHHRRRQLVAVVEEDCLELFFAFPESNLRHKVRRFVRQQSRTEDMAERLAAELTKEVTS
ncbi:hypothetical protein [Pseudomonas syringae]|uniref:Uncharacterized protein n=2 Tax=Pseudomonas syringae TaxID=317 RepID=A0A656JV10_PSESF|nr:hypothetical protein [Pseudomonas syringae]EPN56134.1 hypothetical protein A245_22619 [Pseudomonas syringae pv. actinidiae ICMP 19096]EPM49293.1 hypothetical protein A246_08450 [Pseudomonas syringae pv. actinidiae ICMP 19098]EPN07145.1 hypothetical protein A249_12906 [Pseudomonas syringae pv. actinidiae ICMP 18804]EPN19831.1 hypothetical protein A248_08574 [Pseudomonas syringae pv. actinidiae ICMP 19100]EPN27680.1 hypothetical protein A247_08585 [Pseudomonas syringae pv. actinidiae ICMP 190